MAFKNKKCPICKTKHDRAAMVSVITKGGSLLVCRKCKNTQYKDSDLKVSKYNSQFRLF